MVDFFDCLRQRPAKLDRTLAIVLQQMIGHALRGFRPDTGQPAQGFGKEFKA
jgi:hypothetical protein